MEHTMDLSNRDLFIQKAYVNDTWVDTKAKIEVFNPFDGSVVGTIPKLEKSEIKLAIDCAADSFERLRTTSPFERSKWLNNLYTLIEENAGDLAKIMTIEQGKPIEEAKKEILYGNSFVKWFSEEAIRIYGDVLSTDDSTKNNLVFKQAIGPVVAITPWNFPHAMITRKCAPALAAGCPVIIKPSKETPFSATAFVYLCYKAGFPKNSVQLITGESETIGDIVCKDPKIKKLSFTGSTTAGKKLMEACSLNVKKVSLELGGNAPCIVFEDADIAKAVEGVVAIKFRNAGQTCICANRIFVHKKLTKTFIKLLSKIISSLKVGNGLNQQTQVGPLINDKAIAHLNHLLADAKEKGAKLLLGGKTHESSKLAFSPTIICNVTQEMNIFHEEIFGPIASIIEFEEEEEVIKMANDVPYGLASYFFTKDASRVFRVSKALEYGMVGVNTSTISHCYTPFGGVKESGIGREGSKYGIEEFLEIKYVCFME